MLDHAQRRLELIAKLQSAVPFEVALTPHLAATLKARLESFDAASCHSVTEVTYAGEAGGIMSASSQGPVTAYHRLADPSHRTKAADLCRCSCCLSNAPDQKNSQAVTTSISESRECRCMPYRSAFMHQKLCAPGKRLPPVWQFFRKKSPVFRAQYSLACMLVMTRIVAWGSAGSTECWLMARSK